ncbi:WxL domain-containing protein, partial [Enterococcus faecalis]|uniref:WxL domain-containing protein n=2 Tax=Enterococcus faecalis TaxID=1351 RepID=UPI001F50BDCA
MKQNKWQRLAAIGLCGSLLVNAFSGVTAVAETVTIESSPTAESSVKEETQVSSETQTTSEATTETSQEEVAQETEKQAEVVAEKKEAPPVKAEQEETEAQQETQPTPQLPVEIQNRAIGVKAGNLASAQQQIRTMIANKNFTHANIIRFPEVIFGLAIDAENNTQIQMTDFNLTANMVTMDKTSVNSIITTNVEKQAVPIGKTMSGFDINIPSISFNLNAVTRRRYLDDIILQVPKYVEDITIDAPIVYLWSSGIFNLSDFAELSPATISKIGESKFEISSYETLPEPVEGISRVNKVQHYFSYLANPVSSTSVHVATFLPKNDYKLSLIYKKVTENFVDATGAKITPPTGFTQGQQTSITSNDFTYTSAKALPDTYKAGGKTYKFKGWYKGTDKTALKTTKTPSYAVTYDDKDDMTAVYEDLGETKTYNLPAKDVYFGYVDEAGNLLNPADFTVEAELGESTATESSVLGKVQGTNQVTSKLKKLSIPGKSYDFPVAEIKTYGTRYVNHTIPKRYKTMSITPLATYTGDKTKYPIAKEIRKDIEAPYTLVSQVDGEVAYNLSSNGNVFGIRSVFWSWDTNKTPYAMGIYSGRVGKTYNLASPDGTIYYYLENRRVTENFVDATGAKITPPTGFTQGNKIVIDSENFTYTSAKALPDTYTAGGKTYKFKGWYKGTDKTALKTTKTPSYAVTYDDKDDMTAVYEEVVLVTLPGYTYQFGFVGESGQLIDPAKIGLTYDMWAYEDKKETFTEKSVKASDNGNLKEMKIEDRSVVKPTAETAGQDTIYSPVNLQFTLPKYYQKVTPSDGKNLNYPVPQMIQNSTGREENLPVTEATFALKELQPYTYGMKNLYTNSLTPNTPYPIPFRRYTKWAGGTVPVNIMYSKISPIYYMLENRRVTENFVDAAGAKITPPTGFTQGKQTVIDSENFTYTSAKALPDTYTAGGKTYKFKGW